MRISKHLYVVSALILLLILSDFVVFSNLGRSTVDASSSLGNVDVTANDDNLLQYEWPQFQGDPSFTRFSAGPAPDTSSILWKANITGIQSYIAAFDGMIFVCTNTSVVALDKETGNVLWKTNIPMPRTWPVAYKIDAEHMVLAKF